MTTAPDKLRRCAYHEAAHAVVARFFGADAVPLVFPHERKGWDGVCHIGPGVAARNRRVVGLAGRLAELQLAGELAAALENLESGAVRLGDTDAAACEGYTAEDVDRSSAIVSMYWPEIVTEAEGLLERWR